MGMAATASPIWEYVEPELVTVVGDRRFEGDGVLKALDGRVEPQLIPVDLAGVHEHVAADYAVLAGLVQHGHRLLGLPALEQQAGVIEVGAGIVGGLGDGLLVELRRFVQPAHLLQDVRPQHADLVGRGAMLLHQVERSEGFIIFSLLGVHQGQEIGALGRLWVQRRVALEQFLRLGQAALPEQDPAQGEQTVRIVGRLFQNGPVHVDGLLEERLNVFIRRLPLAEHGQVHAGQELAGLDVAGIFPDQALQLLPGVPELLHLQHEPRPFHPEKLAVGIEAQGLVQVPLRVDEPVGQQVVAGQHVIEVRLGRIRLSRRPVGRRGALRRGRRLLGPEAFAPAGDGRQRGARQEAEDILSIRFMVVSAFHV